MAKPVDTRQYKIPDAALKQLADSLKNSIERDADYFATRNIGLTQLDALQLLIDAFDATTTDEELFGAMTAATEVKDQAAEDLRRAIRPIRSMADITYNSRGKYHVFAFGDLARQSDANLYRLARRVVRVATRLLPELQPQGLTAAQVSAVDALATNLDHKIDLVGDAEETRELEKHDRIAKGNALYAETMRLASIGKSLFEDTDAARYNDYVLIGG